MATLTSPIPVNDLRWHRPCRVEQHRHFFAASRLRRRRQRSPHPCGGPQPGRQGDRHDTGLQGPAAATEGCRGGPWVEEYRHELSEVDGVDGSAGGAGGRGELVDELCTPSGAPPTPEGLRGPDQHRAHVAAVPPGSALAPASCRRVCCTSWTATARCSSSADVPPSSGSHLDLLADRSVGIVFLADRRNRQIRPRSGCGARGGARAAHASSGDRVPSALCRRGVRSSGTCPDPRARR